MADLERLCFGCMRVKPDYSDECPYCKFDNSKDNAENLLRIRTKLQKRYVIGRKISENGEGVTYLGFDLFSSNSVRIREFFPQDICERVGDLIGARLGSEADFARNKQEFVLLAKGLNRMNGCSGLLNVIDIFEDNGTVYYVTENIESIPFRDFLLRNGGALTYEQFRPLLLPLLSTLSSLHAVDIVHGGISPETIIVGKDGVLRLIDFCIADVRKARSDLAPQLYKGFAAIEQYGFDGEQGPWTDVYAIAACFYRTLVGSAPPEATSRVTNDKMTIPASVAQNVPKGVLSALADALEIMPNERTRSIDEMKSQLVSAGVASSSSTQKPKSKAPLIITICAIVAILVISGIAVVNLGVFSSKETTTSTKAVIQTTTVEEINVDDNLVPKFVNVNYAEVLSSPAYLKVRAKYNIIVVSKKYSDQAEGMIISQSPKEATKINSGDTIKLVVSLGSQKRAIPNVVGLSKDEAYIKLLEAGFKATNISFGQKYDENSAPESVVDISPKVGDEVDIDMKITVNINAFTTTATTTTAQATTTQEITTQATTKKPRTTKPTTSKPTTTEQEPMDGE